MCSPYAHDEYEYEYRLGYQYKDGSVGHTESERGRTVVAHRDTFAKHNSWLLMTGPWIEHRRIGRWERENDHNQIRD